MRDALLPLLLGFLMEVERPEVPPDDLLFELLRDLIPLVRLEDFPDCGLSALLRDLTPLERERPASLPCRLLPESYCLGRAVRSLAAELRPPVQMRELPLRGSTERRVRRLLRSDPWGLMRVRSLLSRTAGSWPVRAW